MNIGLDCRLYGIEHAGIGRYVLHLIEALQSIPEKHHYTLFLSPQYCQSLKLSNQFTKIPAPFRHYSLSEQIAFLALLNKANLDLLHVPHFNVPVLYRKPLIVTIHDILWHEVRGGDVTTLSPLKYYAKYLGYRFVVRNAITHAKSIIVPSRFVRNKLESTFTGITPKIHVISEGVDEIFYEPGPLNDLKNLKIAKPYLIYTGSAYPHKNLPFLIQAFEKVSTNHPNLNLVIVSARTVFLEKIRLEIKNRNLTAKVKILEKVPDRDLATIYHHAVALVHPSKSEGFGLTGLEAMAAGTVVIASSVGSLPEVYEDNALYCDPDDLKSLVKQLKTVLSPSFNRTETIKKGIKHAQKFNWRTMAESIVKEYDRVLK